MVGCDFQHCNYIFFFFKSQIPWLCLLDPFTLKTLNHIIK